MKFVDLVGGLNQSDGIEDLIVVIFNPSKTLLGGLLEKNNVILILTCILNTTWFSQNDKIFKGRKSLFQDIKSLEQSVEEFKELLTSREASLGACREQVRWTHPHDFLNINVDVIVRNIRERTRIGKSSITLMSKTNTYTVCCVK